MIVVTIYISNPDSVLLTYNKLKVYRSNYQDGYFLEITTDSTRPTITSSQKYYNYEDTSGTSSSWYKTSYYNSSTLAESSLSTASKGIEIEQEYVDISYPAEINMTSTDHYTVDSIRTHIGDQKKVVREYVSPSCTVGYDSVSNDGYTYKLDNRGWPLRVEKDTVVYTSSSNPYVTDYSYVTFSGTQLSTVSGVLDIWYESFRHSDREILKKYNSAQNPAFVSSTAVTAEMLRLITAIALIKEEIAKLLGETSGSFTLTNELSYNPEPLLRQKRAFLEDLQGRLDELISEASVSNITGVRID